MCKPPTEPDGENTNKYRNANKPTIPLGGVLARTKVPYQADGSSRIPDTDSAVTNPAEFPSFRGDSAGFNKQTDRPALAFQ